ncbi:MAG: hypothetical protein P8N30_09490 [Tateyamaria sp.]|nr:hypothetical protein [Tateyamaria sp.]
MRLLFTAIFLITANGAAALGEGGYVVNHLIHGSGWVLLDTKTGKFRVCNIDDYVRVVRCISWFDGVDGPKTDHALTFNMDQPMGADQWERRY